MQLLWRIEHGLQSTSKWMENSLGVTGPQRLVLKVVEEMPGITARELSHILRLHPSTLTGILRRLELKGVLERTRDAEDTRRVRLRTTKAARQFTRRSSGTVESAIEHALAQLGPKQISAARAVLAAVALELEETSSLNPAQS